jgi:nucleotide-binding universal stress UspA family protein
LILLSVVEPPTLALTNQAPPEMALFQKAMQSLYTEAEQYLKGKCGEFKVRNINSRMLVKQGPVVETIINTVEETAADLVLIASHGRTGFQKVFFGSVASGVLNRLEKPLMIIRTGEA